MPFCPQCKFEYEPEIGTCPDCQEPLVAELPTEEDQASTEDSRRALVTVYGALNYSDAALMESLLQGSGVPVYLAEDGIGISVGVRSFQVQVPPPYIERARAILEEAAHLAEKSEAPEAPRPEEMDLPEMDDDGEV